MADSLDALEHGPLHHFADWPNPDIPPAAAGVYTVWDGDRFIYVGMAGRGLSADDLVERRTIGRTGGLMNRLNSHASGRRSGDQFCVYICDRFVVPLLSNDQLTQIGAGTLLLDQLTRDYIRQRLSYRFFETSDGAEAISLEREIQAGALTAGRPLLNPISGP